MKQYTYSETRQRLAEVLARARRDGAVRIRRRDGTTFLLSAETAAGSPLDVPAVPIGPGRDAILSAIHEGRRDR